MTIDLAEVDGRIIMLTQQRDGALTQCVLMAGKIAMLENRVRELESKDGAKDETITPPADS